MSERLHARWLDNAERGGLTGEDIEQVTRAGIAPASFHALAGLAEITDPHGKSYFLIPPGAPAVRVRAAVLMAAVFNAGSGYRGGDFAATGYGPAEVQRIRARQFANAWSYRRASAIAAAGALAATPHGILMGLGGSRAHRLASRRGGTTYGDVFLINLPTGNDPVALLTAIIESGVGWYLDDGTPRPGRLPLERLLHHEERHARQWAALGPLRMSLGYLAAEARAVWTGEPNTFEAAAGLADGGYR
ncbi:hypothetical protein [Mycobacterium sp. 1274756.6]|uniref:hypothetical protein n=1 Tax=Mycobacterium sp. 1274756.6 TaxID=1834076 RepID=UPI0007FFEF7D|nr:hypothetical protein [Mycobacterium sp. 1274756.6]OBJ72324.1 hypothetical protein A5643_05870 [Mycobacterium sp. 1274756.6]